MFLKMTGVNGEFKWICNERRVGDGRIQEILF
jgi:hypothetical protein